MIKILKKYFIPNEDNDYKPHILRRASVSVIAFIALLIFFFGITQTLVLQKTDFLSAVIPQTLIALANNDRTQEKLGGLLYNVVLEQAAQSKANDMAAKGYFAHNSPDGKTPWHWFTNAGYKYVTAGENLAINFTDSVDVNQAWMNSPGHRANILNARFTEIGIATAQGSYQGRDTVFVVQMFGRPAKIPAKVSDAQTQDLTSVSPTNQVTKNTLPASSVLGSETPDKVLSESETFIAVESEVALSDETSQVTSVAQAASATWFENILVSPRKTMSVLYLFLGGFVLLSLFLMVVIEIRRQHPRHIAYGVGLIAFILALTYIYRTFLFTHVIVL